MKHPIVSVALLALPLLLPPGPAHASPPEEAIETLLQVGPEGEGNAGAMAAMEKLQAATLDDLPLLLRSLNGANPLATNYLRAVIDALIGRETAAGTVIPLSLVSEILLDPRQGDQARMLAFRLVEESAPETAAKLVPGFLNDPSNSLRRRAVARLLEQAAAVPGDEAGGASLLYRQALGAARDVDQVQQSAKALAKLGRPVDLPRQFGFLMHWSIIGPFDNANREGFAAVYPPEEQIEPEATYPGKEGDVRWQAYATSDPYGKVDFNAPYGLRKEVTAYAHAEFHSGSARSAEIRLGTKNAWKVWLNGELLFGRDEYHRGQRIDQYRLPVNLRRGKNDILVKVCQDEQEKDWTVEWEFKLRVCDETGAALLSTQRLPTPQPPAATRRPSTARPNP